MSSQTHRRLAVSLGSPSRSAIPFARSSIAAPSGKVVLTWYSLELCSIFSPYLGLLIPHTGYMLVGSAGNVSLLWRGVIIISSWT